MINQIMQESIDIFKQRFARYLTFEFEQKYGENWLERAFSPPDDDTLMIQKKAPQNWDISITAILYHAHWKELFEAKAHYKFPRALMTLIK